MIPGPNIYYKCPTCGAYLYTPSLISGNTIGARYYSDGEMIAPMMPEFPNLTKCEGCGTLVKLSQLERVDYDNKNSNIKSVPRNLFKQDIADKQDVAESKIYQCHHLGVADLEKALDLYPDEELAIRLKMWRRYNDRIRFFLDFSRIFNKSIDYRSHEFDYNLEWYRNNCLTLLALLDPNDKDQLLLMAELNRNLGNFEECLRLVSLSKNWRNINYSHDVPIEQILIRECKKGNKCTVLINDYHKELIAEAKQQEQKRINEEKKDPRWKVCLNRHCFENIRTACIWCGSTKVVARLDKNIEIQHKVLYIGKLKGHYILTEDANIPKQEDRVRKITIDYYQDKFIYFHLDGKNPNPVLSSRIKLDGGMINGLTLRKLCEDIVKGECTSVDLTKHIC